MAFVLDVNLRIQQILGLEKIKAQLTGITGGTKGVNVPVNVSSGDIAKLNQLSTGALVASKSLKTASVSAATFGQSIFLAGKRYLAFVVATAVPIAIIATLKKGTQSVIEFNKEINQLSQILNKPVSQLGELRTLILDLAASTGTSRSEISSLAKTLSQAGIRGDDLTKTLGALAKIPLVAVFQDSASATETFLAALNQFNTEGITAEGLFDKLTAVSKEFATSAEDLGEGIRKAGGAFAAVGGTLDELIATFTAIRSVTRESASVVGTSIRNLATRIADLDRLERIEKILELDLRDENGELLSFLDVIRRLKPAFDSASTGVQALVAKELGGLRQISRAFALLSDQGVGAFEKSLVILGKSAGAFGKDAAKGLETLEAQFGQLTGELDRLFQSLAEPVFIPLIKGVTNLAKAFVGIAESLGPVLPLFIQLIGFTAGIKGLVAALKLIPGTLAAISGINIAGVLAGGAAAARGGGVAGGIPGQQAFPFAESNKAKVALLGVSTAAKKLISSQLAQTIALGAATIGLNALQTEAEESGQVFLGMAASVAKTITALTLFATVLSGRTIQQFSASLGGAANSLKLLGTAALVGLVIEGTIRASAIQEELEKKITEAIKKIDVDFAGGAELDDAAGNFIGEIVKTIQEAGKAVDPKTLSGLFANLGNRIEDLLNGEIGQALGRVTIDTREIEGFVNAALADPESREKFRALLGEAIAKFGTDFEKGLIESSSEFLKNSHERNFSKST